MKNATLCVGNREIWKEYQIKNVSSSTFQRAVIWCENQLSIYMLGKEERTSRFCRHRNSGLPYPACRAVCEEMDQRQGGKWGYALCFSRR
jgi:hypothetical protein